MTDKEIIQKVLKVLHEVLTELMADDTETKRNLRCIQLEIEAIAEKHRNG